MTDIVEVVSCRSEWPNLFEIEAGFIKNALGDNCIAIHHIGSTAVPGLSAKPIIDIFPVVKDILLARIMFMFLKTVILKLIDI